MRRMVRKELSCIPRACCWRRRKLCDGNTPGAFFVRLVIQSVFFGAQGEIIRGEA